jgi:hypothetical protein
MINARQLFCCYAEVHFVSFLIRLMFFALTLIDYVIEVNGSVFNEIIFYLIAI